VFIQNYKTVTFCTSFIFKK